MRTNGFMNKELFYIISLHLVPLEAQSFSNTNTLIKIYYCSELMNVLLIQGDFRFSGYTSTNESTAAES